MEVMYAECSAQVTADNRHFLGQGVRVLPKVHSSDQLGSPCSGALSGEETKILTVMWQSPHLPV